MKKIEEELGWFERACDKLHLLATTEENKRPMLVLVEKALTHLALQIHTDAIKELEGRKQTDDNQMSFDHAFDEGINEAITYHKEEIMKLAEPKAIYAKTNEGDVYLKD